MNKMNIVIKGKYKGYKIVFDRDNNSIQLKSKRQIIPLNSNIKSVCITKEILREQSIYYFQIVGSTEKVYCLLDFSTYILLIILGMKVPTNCIL